MMKNFIKVCKRPYFWIPVALVLMIALGIFLHGLRQQQDLQRFVNCIETRKLTDCQPPDQLPTNRIVEKSLTDAIYKRADNMPNQESLQFLRQLHSLYPALPGLEQKRVEFEVVQLRKLFAEHQPAAFTEGGRLLAQFPNNPTLHYELGLLQLQRSPPALVAATSHFANAIGFDQGFRDKAVILETIPLALAVLNRSQLQKNFSFIDADYIEKLELFLRQQLSDHNNPRVRSNAFTLLELAGRVDDEETFQHHWLNLLSGTTKMPQLYQEAVLYFEKLAENSGAAAELTQRKLDYKYFPVIDQLPDYYTRQTLRLLLKHFPKQTKAFLKKNLRNRQQHWRRSNSFYALQESNLLGNNEVYRYHNINLSRPSYPNFTGWLADSIDYFSRRGRSGKQKLRQLAARVARLRSQSKRAGKKEAAKVYAEIESYTRKKIGRRN